jgi:peptidoglycan-associated lipoprotein
MSRGLRSLGGKHGESRAVYSKEDFYKDVSRLPPQTEFVEDQFVPLVDESRQEGGSACSYAAPQPAISPGDPGCAVPGIEAFQDPSINPQIAGIFKNIQFDYNQDLVKGDDNREMLRDIGEYMRQRPNVFVFVEGHCDERGPEAYNFALGARRANSVRNALIDSGVHPDHIFTISYGKERPLMMDHHEEAWQKNRRAEFKVYIR